MEITGIFTALFVGLIIGLIGRLVVPGRQNLPTWLMVLVGAVAALLGTMLAASLAVAQTPGVDWIELLLQVMLSAVGVALATHLYNERSV